MDVLKCAEKIITLIVGNDKGGKFFDFYPPNGLHAKLRILFNRDLHDRIQRECSSNLSALETIPIPSGRIPPRYLIGGVGQFHRPETVARTSKWRLASLKPCKRIF